MTGGLVLAHGAGSNRNAPLLVAVDRAFTAAGVAVERVDLAFRERRPKGPPGPGDAMRDRAGLRAAIEAMRRRTAGPAYLGGHSYGGRQASILASEDPSLAEALLLLSYPLHPPGKPEAPRTAHFPALRTPALFVHGGRDPFGSPEEMRAALALIPARTDLLIRETAGHDLSREAAFLDQIIAAFAALIAATAR